MIDIDSLKEVKTSYNIVEYRYKDVVFSVEKLKRKYQGSQLLYKISFKNKKYHEILKGQIGWTNINEKFTRVISYNIGGTMEYVFKIINKYEEEEKLW